eukprot:355368-Chlamydomonas_euryale.AAC.7
MEPPRRMGAPGSMPNSDANHTGWGYSQRPSTRKLPHMRRVSTRAPRVASFHKPRAPSQVSSTPRPPVRSIICGERLGVRLQLWRASRARSFRPCSFNPARRATPAGWGRTRSPRSSSARIRPQVLLNGRLECQRSNHVWQ